MLETPKSFEEWVNAEYPYLHSIVGAQTAESMFRIARHAWNAALSLPPQAAAVPARQDAVPEKENGGNNAAPRPADALDDRADNRSGGGSCHILPVRQDEPRLTTQPPQAAVGEGELPELDEQCKEELTWKTLGTFDSLSSLLECRERQLREERKAHKQAIAQRDEARKDLEQTRAALNAALGSLAEMPRIIHEARVAALDVPKPESGELERLWSTYSRPVPHEFLGTGIMQYQDFARALRSLPSEPEGNRKAVENG